MIQFILINIFLLSRQFHVDLFSDLKLPLTLFILLDLLEAYLLLVFFHHIWVNCSVLFNLLNGCINASSLTPACFELLVFLVFLIVIFLKNIWLIYAVVAVNLSCHLIWSLKYLPHYYSQYRNDSYYLIVSTTTTTTTTTTTIN